MVRGLGKALTAWAPGKEWQRGMVVEQVLGILQEALMMRLASRLKDLLGMGIMAGKI